MHAEQLGSAHAPALALRLAFASRKAGQRDMTALLEHRTQVHSVICQDFTRTAEKN